MDDRTLLVRMLRDVDRATERVIEEEAATRAAEAAAEAAVAKSCLLRRRLLELRVALAIRDAERLCEENRLDRRARALEAQLNALGVRGDAAKLERERWKPVLDRENEAIEMRCAEARARAEAEARRVASRRVDEEGARMKRELLEAKRARDDAQLWSDEADRALEAANVDVAASLRAEDEALTQPVSEEEEEASTPSDARLGEEYGCIERTVFALFEALGTSPREKFEFAWAVEEALPADPRVLHELLKKKA